MGGFAELAVARESALSHKPAELSFAQASTLPQAGAIALQGTATVRPGQRVLVNGAGGGSGSFAIQLAKQAGAHVTAVDNALKLEHMRALGADEVVDYRVAGLHPAGAVRPGPRPRGVPVGVRLPAGPGSGRPVPVRRRLGARRCCGSSRSGSSSGG